MNCSDYYAMLPDICNDKYTQAHMDEINYQPLLGEKTLPTDKDFVLQNTSKSPRSHIL